MIQRSKGQMMREVRLEEPASVEKPKMIDIQRRTGSQYFRNGAKREPGRGGPSVAAGAAAGVGVGVGVASVFTRAWLPGAQGSILVELALHKRFDLAHGALGIV